MQVFVTERSALAQPPRALRAEAAPWISWPKRAAGVATDVTGDVVRSALPLGLVDRKVGALGAVGSARKRVIRKALR